MFEFHRYDGKLRGLPAAKPERPYAPVDAVAGMALLCWGEHCVECAAPACYESCDLYQPRTDLRCRRFGFGAYKNRAFPSVRGYGVEISFKKWAKLEAFANTNIHKVRHVRRLERLLECSAPVTDAAGRLLNRLTGHGSWTELTYLFHERLARALHRRASNGERPDAFVLEVYNPANEPSRLQVIFAVSQDDVLRDGGRFTSTPPIIRTVVLPSGYSRHELDARALEPVSAREMPWKITMIPEAEKNAQLVFLMADLVKFKSPAARAQPAKQIKCVVWDLDNTLWDGTLVENDDVTLRPGVRELLKGWDERGILQSVASKNDFAPAWEKLQALSVADFFLYPQIDWLPKSQKIKALARQLNLGLDSFAFIDDNRFELEEVSRAMPQVTCLNGQDLAPLFHDPRFAGAATDEARGRRRFYQQQIAREIDQEQSGGDYLNFLASCAVSLEISAFSEEHRERVEELVQRTNQLNFSGRKYSRAELREAIADGGLQKLVLRCSDKYGSYGTVGFCLARYGTNAVEILDLMLSCRVQGKFIEQALFSHLLAHHDPRGARALWVDFRRTERNTPARNVLDAMGFQPGAARGDGGAAGLVLRAREPLRCNLIAVRCLLCAAAGAVAAAAG